MENQHDAKFDVNICKPPIINTMNTCSKLQDLNSKVGDVINDFV